MLLLDISFGLLPAYPRYNWCTNKGVDKGLKFYVFTLLLSDIGIFDGEYVNNMVIQHI